MKKIIVLVLALSLAGCAGIPRSVLDGGSSIIADTTNPITSERLYQIEASLSTAASAAIVYRRNCLAKVLPQSCRAIVEKIRGYSRTARLMLSRLRAFVRQNDQVNAIKVLLEVQGVISDLRSTVGATQ